MFRQPSFSQSGFESVREPSKGEITDMKNTTSASGVHARQVGVRENGAVTKRSRSILLLAGLSLLLLAVSGCISKSGNPLDEIEQAQHDERVYQRIVEYGEQKEKEQRLFEEARERQARAARNFSRNQPIIYGNEGGSGGGGGGGGGD